MSGTNPPLNENFEFLKIMIFNFIFVGEIWKYFSDFFKVHIKGGYQLKNAHACMRMHMCSRMPHAWFCNLDPLDMYLKKLRKIFPNFPQKN